MYRTSKLSISPKIELVANWKLAKSKGRGVRLEARDEEGARRTAEWRLDPRKAVAARKAAPPP